MKSKKRCNKMIFVGSLLGILAQGSHAEEVIILDDAPVEWEECELALLSQADLAQQETKDAEIRIISIEVVAKEQQSEVEVQTEQQAKAEVQTVTEQQADTKLQEETEQQTETELQVKNVLLEETELQTESELQIMTELKKDPEPQTESKLSIEIPDNAFFYRVEKNYIWNTKTHTYEEQLHGAWLNEYQKITIHNEGEEDHCLQLALLADDEAAISSQLTMLNGQKEVHIQEFMLRANEDYECILHLPELPAEQLLELSAEQSSGQLTGLSSDLSLELKLGRIVLKEV